MSIAPLSFSMNKRYHVANHSKRYHSTMYHGAGLRSRYSALQVIKELLTAQDCVGARLRLSTLMRLCHISKGLYSALIQIVWYLSTSDSAEMLKFKSRAYNHTGTVQNLVDPASGPAIFFFFKHLTRSGSQYIVHWTLLSSPARARLTSFGFRRKPELNFEPISPPALNFASLDLTRDSKILQKPTRVKYQRYSKKWVSSIDDSEGIGKNPQLDCVIFVLVSDLFLNHLFLANVEVTYLLSTILNL